MFDTQSVCLKLPLLATPFFEVTVQCPDAGVALLYMLNLSSCLLILRSMRPVHVLKKKAANFPFSRVHVGGGHWGAIPMHSSVPQGSVIGPLLFLLFVNDLPDVLETMTLLFADDAKMVTRRSQSMTLHSCLTAACDWSKKWDLPINPTKCSYLAIGREIPLRMSFFPDGSGTPIPVSTLVKDLGGQTDNLLSPSAQCSEAANKARRLIFMIRRSFQYLSKSAFIPLYGALVHPHLAYGMPACSQNLVADINHIERIQRLATWLVTGMRYLP